MTAEGYATNLSDLDLFLSPLVQIDRLDLGDVDPQVSMDTSTADTDEYAQIPGRPSWPWQRDKSHVYVSERSVFRDDGR